MNIQEVTIGELGAKPTLLEALEEIAYRHKLPEGNQSARSVLVSKLVPYLEFEDLKIRRNVGMVSIDKLRTKLKKLGYTFTTCPFLFDETKSEARETLMEKLHQYNLSEREFDLIWKITLEHFPLYVSYRYDE